MSKYILPALTFLFIGSGYAAAYSNQSSVLALTEEQQSQNLSFGLIAIAVWAVWAFIVYKTWCSLKSKIRTKLSNVLVASFLVATVSGFLYFLSAPFINNGGACPLFGDAMRSCSLIGVSLPIDWYVSFILGLITGLVSYLYLNLDSD